MFTAMLLVLALTCSVIQAEGLDSPSCETPTPIPPTATVVSTVVPPTDTPIIPITTPITKPTRTPDPVPIEERIPTEEPGGPPETNTPDPTPEYTPTATKPPIEAPPTPTPTPDKHYVPPPEPTVWMPLPETGLLESEEIPREYDYILGLLGVIFVGMVCFTIIAVVWLYTRQ